MNSFLYLTYLMLLLLSLRCIRCSNLCNHQPPAPHEVNRVHLESHHVLNKRSASQPLRIKVFYDESVKELPPEKYMVINNTVLPQALDYWQKALLVKPLGVPIKLSRKCPNNKAFFPESGGPHQYCVERCEPVTTCGEVVVPDNHLDVCRHCDPYGRRCKTKTDDKASGEGISGADFIFYVSSMQTERCNKGATVAYAAHCQQESAMDRPVAGHANLCPESISTKPQDLETLLSTVKHEILHALGFSVSLYAYFRDKNGNPLTKREKNGKPPVLKDSNSLSVWGEGVIRRVTRTHWRVKGAAVRKDIHMVVTPRVVAEVRQHFNCHDLEGAELEDQGEDGTILTHWEKRVFENEAMTGTHTQSPVYSRITLALMEDTGWYLPDYSMAQPLKWGKNLGCDFAMKSCKEWIDAKRSKKESIHPFCDKVKKDPLETECTDTRDAVALCNLMEYGKDLPTVFQNFDYIPGVKNNKDVARFGGSVNLADYCPYIQEFTWKSNDVVVRGSQCQFVENNPQQEKNFALEFYGHQSKCFNHNSQMWEERTCTQVRQWQHWGSGCYQYLCKEGRLHLEVANHTFTCFHEGQELKVQLHVNRWLHIGTIVCPKCQEICQPLGMDCRSDMFKSHSVLEKSYYKDFLKCASEGRGQSPTVILISLVTFLLYFHFCVWRRS